MLGFRSRQRILSSSLMPASIPIAPGTAIPASEIRFEFTRSGGPGGQNVNKVSTRVELHFNVRNSSGLDDRQKERIHAALAGRIDGDGVLRLASQESRSQWRNREDVLEKFVQLISAAITPKKKRRPTAPSRTSKEKRFRAKQTRATKKRMRGRVNPED